MTDNERIAKFMGLEYNSIYQFWILPKIYKGGEARELLFHTSWDWLMPVVQKIRKVKGDEDLKARISAALLLAELNMLYVECVRFIKWEWAEE